MFYSELAPGVQLNKRLPTTAALSGDGEVSCLLWKSVQAGVTLCQSVRRTRLSNLHQDFANAQTCVWFPNPYFLDFWWGHFVTVVDTISWIIPWEMLSGRLFGRGTKWHVTPALHPSVDPLVHYWNLARELEFSGFQNSTLSLLRADQCQFSPAASP